MQASPIGSTASPWSLKRVGWKRRRASEPRIGSPRRSSCTAMLKASPASKRVQQTGQRCAPRFCSAASSAGPGGRVAISSRGESKGAASESEKPISRPVGVQARCSGGRPRSLARSSKSAGANSPSSSPEAASKSIQAPVRKSRKVSVSSKLRASRPSSSCNVDVSAIVTGPSMATPLTRGLLPGVGVRVSPCAAGDTVT